MELAMEEELPKEEERDPDDGDEAAADAVDEEALLTDALTVSSACGQNPQRRPRSSHVAHPLRRWPTLSRRSKEARRRSEG